VRLLLGLAFVVSLVAIAVAGLALRSAHRSRDAAHRTELRLERSQARLTQYRDELQRQIRANATTRKAMTNLCYSARNATIPRADDYALQVGRAIIQGIVDSCDYAKVPRTKG
jgi:hypothetical protein